jgi:hypothetical protein
MHRGWVAPSARPRGGPWYAIGVHRADAEAGKILKAAGPATATRGEETVVFTAGR